MRLYESVYVIAATMPEDELPQLTQKVEGIITQQDGLVVKHTPWGKNKLAYNIKTHGFRHDKGYYFHLEYLSSPAAVGELERNFKIDERFLRYITVKLEERPDIEAMKARAEEEKAKAAPAAPAPEEPEPAEEEVSEESPPVEEAGAQEPSPEAEPAEEESAQEAEPEAEPAEEAEAAAEELSPEPEAEPEAEAEKEE